MTVSTSGSIHTPGAAAPMAVTVGHKWSEAVTVAEFNLCSYHGGYHFAMILITLEARLI